MDEEHSPGLHSWCIVTATARGKMNTGAVLLFASLVVLLLQCAVTFAIAIEATLSANSSTSVSLRAWCKICLHKS